MVNWWWGYYYYFIFLLQQMESKRDQIKLQNLKQASAFKAITKYGDRSFFVVHYTKGLYFKNGKKNCSGHKEIKSMDPHIYWNSERILVPNLFFSSYFAIKRWCKTYTFYCFIKFLSFLIFTSLLAYWCYSI